uniref:Decaprenyl-phosphate phosphoribosyltransferase n=1 Tax=candidate division WOR-3 bacterium TaxID=2052148 RepID=A0A7C4Y9W2_UNCW3
MLSRIKDYIRILRPKHWTKNFLIFAGLLFSFSFDKKSIILSFLGFVIFTLISSSVYIINDIIDAEKDKLHPKKRYRPIPSGRIKKKTAGFLSFIIFLPTIFFSSFLGMKFFLTVSLYFILNILYSLFLKNVVLMDIFIIAIGFILRALAGVFIIDVYLSNWFILATLFISLFLAGCKRRHELLFIDDKAKREVLKHYNAELIDILISIFSTSTIITYSIYVIMEHPEFIFSIVFVIYGIGRYLYIVYKKEEGGEPEKHLLNDIHILLTVLLYVFFIILVHFWRGY